MNTLARFSLFVLAALLLTADVADAQGIFGRIRDAAQRGVERAVDREVSRQADRATTAVIGAAEDAVVCALTDDACIEQARNEFQGQLYSWLGWYSLASLALGFVLGLWLFILIDRRRKLA